MADAPEASEDLGDALLYALGATSDDSDDGAFSPPDEPSLRSLDGAHKRSSAPAPATGTSDRPCPPVRSRASLASAKLDALPTEVLWKILTFLSASDLVSCCTVSHSIAAAAVGNSPGAEQLWRRLFRARWGRNAEMPGFSAKAAYFDWDRREVAHLTQTVPDFLRPFYIQMAQSKRCQCPGREHDDAATASEQHSSPAVAEWRRRRGFRGSFAPATHVCQQPTFCHVADAFLCEHCGWAHVCDDTCKERFLDGESYVCPISGYSSNRLVTEWEEAGAAAARGDDAAAEDGAEMGGQLARAYVDGWNCSDEAELRRVCFTAF